MAEIVSSDFQPDLIVYIARAGFLIAKEIQNVTGAEIVGIDASRQGGKLKEFAEPLLVHLPKFILNFARKVEVKSDVHEKNTERSVNFHPSVNKVDPKKMNKILVVDDAVDTGYSIKAVVGAINDKFPSAQIRTAALNVWDSSEKVVKTDYFIFRNTSMRTPMSKDSCEYKVFKRLYDNCTKEGYI